MIEEKRLDRDISQVPSPEHRRQYERGMDVDEMVSSLRTRTIGDALTRLGEKAQRGNSVTV
jgi:hypothetical protein